MNGLALLVGMAIAASCIGITTSATTSDIELKGWPEEGQWFLEGMIYWTDGSTILDAETQANFNMIICIDYDGDGLFWNPGTGLPVDEADYCFSDANMNGYGAIDDSNIPMWGYWSHTIQVGQPGGEGNMFKVWVNGSKFTTIASQDGYCGKMGATPQADGTYSAIDSTFILGPDGMQLWHDMQIPGPAATKTYGPAAPTNVRTWLVGSQALATDVNVSWNAVAGATGYNIYRGTAPYSIDFAAPLNGGVPIVALQYVDAGAIAGAPQYYYSVRSVAGGVESATSETVGKYTMSLLAGYNAFGCPLALFPERVDYQGHLLCDWRLIRATSADRIPNATTIFTYTYATQSWKGRAATTPDAIPHTVINPHDDGLLMYMSQADSYTWVGWPAEQIRTANFSGATPLSAPGNFHVEWSGADIRLTWDAVVGANRYEVYTATSRSLMNYNFASPAYSGTNLFWVDAGANTTVGQKYYIVVAVDGDGDKGDSSYAAGKCTRSLGAGYNAITTPFESFRGHTDTQGHQLCDWTLIDGGSPFSYRRIPNATVAFTFDVSGQRWVGRSSSTPEFVSHRILEVQGMGMMVYMGAAGTYTWVG
ncbi:MAG: hypothetical protein V1934_06445 [Methanobacteriota archaeon]